MSKFQPPRGTHDLLADEQFRHSHIINTAKSLCANFGFSEVSTPIFESTAVFSRTLGDDSDIVHKEMYTFEDRGGASLTLRPEGTAGVARAVVSEGLTRDIPLKFFYQGPMFRYERPQKGRQRQFHQLGVELIGVSQPLADIEVISLAHQFLNQLGLKELVKLEINTIGDESSRQLFRERLVDFLIPLESQLSEDSRRRLRENPLRILDSKIESDQNLLKEAPTLKECLSEESIRIYETLCNGLTKLSIPFTESPRLVRGLDYYCHCVFEFTSDQLGAQNTVLAGGRYDRLIEMMGGPSLPGVGWASGIERLSLIAQTVPQKTRPIFLCPLDEESESPALELAHAIAQKLPVEMTYAGNLGKRMKKANKAQARAAIIIGSEERKNQQVTLKDLDSGEQFSVSEKDLLDRLQSLY